MIDTAKLLGGLLNGSLDSSMGSMGSGRLPGRAAVGMGILGVAIAAFEHFAEQNGTTPRGISFPEARGGPGRAVPPPPPVAPQPETFPSSMGAAPPPPPPASPPPSVAGVDPVLLLRAMIAAAHSDGSLDNSERERILSYLERAELSEEERAFMARELDAPRSMADIVASVGSPSEAEQVFAVSQLALEVDTGAERAYLEELRRSLGIDPAKAAEIARNIGR